VVPWCGVVLEYRQRGIVRCRGRWICGVRSIWHQLFLWYCLDTFAGVGGGGVLFFSTVLHVCIARGIPKIGCSFREVGCT
jgi:hypothetical protein